MKAGDHFTIEITSNKMNDVGMIEMYLAYDNTKFKAVGSNARSWFAGMEMKDINLAPIGDKDGNPNNGEIWITGMSLNAQSCEMTDVIATVTFEVLTDVTENSEICVIGETLSCTHDVIDHVIHTANGGVTIGGDGDITGDGAVNMRDVMVFYKMQSTGESLTEEQKASADVNGDGRINMYDVQMAYRVVSGA